MKFEPAATRYINVASSSGSAGFTGHSRDTSTHGHSGGSVRIIRTPLYPQSTRDNKQANQREYRAQGRERQTMSVILHTLHAYTYGKKILISYMSVLVLIVMIAMVSTF